MLVTDPERPLGELYGVTTDSNGRVTRLDLHELFMEGTLPAKLGNLSKLTYLDLRGNSFRGTIPAELGNLSNLTHLYFGCHSSVYPDRNGCHSFTGCVPAGLSDVPNSDVRHSDFGMSFCE